MYTFVHIFYMINLYDELKDMGFNTFVLINHMTGVPFSSPCFMLDMAFKKIVLSDR